MLVAKLVSAVEEEMELPEGSMGCMPRNKDTTEMEIDRRHKISLTIRELIKGKKKEKKKKHR